MNTPEHNPMTDPDPDPDPERFKQSKWFRTAENEPPIADEDLSRIKMEVNNLVFTFAHPELRLREAEELANDITEQIVLRRTNS